MAMDTKAYDVGTSFLFVVHLDTTRTIPDPSLPVPEDGQEDTRPFVADPAWVVSYPFGKALPVTEVTRDDGTVLSLPLKYLPNDKATFTQAEIDAIPQFTLAEYLAQCKANAEGLAAEELAKRQPAEEISLPL